jgi:hypothetical protein
MRRIVLPVIVLVGFALVLPSCFKKKPDPEADKAAIRELVEKDTVHFSGSTSHDSTEGFFADGDTLVWWWRSAQTHDSAAGINVWVSGDSGFVEWSQHNYGFFYVLAKRPDTNALELWTKPLVENVSLRAVFFRTGESTDSARGWQISGISLAAGASESTHTVTIDSMNILSSLRNLTIVDPLNTFFNADTTVTFTPGEHMTVTLYTNADGGNAFLHTFVLFWPFYLRVPFTHQGNGVFVGNWNAPVIPSLRFAIFDLQSRSTIYSSDQPYDFQGWLLPYRIKTAK